MWQLLSKLLNTLGNPLVKTSNIFSKVSITIGNPAARDAMDATYWRDYAEQEKLFDVWGPVAGSPWEPYHCVPLFAALTTIAKERTGPTDPDRVREIEGNGHLGTTLLEKPLGQSWAADRAWVILDLPGATSVAAAIRLMAAGFQPVCTFDNWPHQAGLIKSEIILAQLLRYAAHARERRQYLTKDSPPLWVCDRNRLGASLPRPRDFDNRYYLDDSILPAPDTLKKNGIATILCIVPETTDMPCPDLRAYFRDLRKDGFLDIYGVAFRDPELTPFRFSDAVYTVNFKQSGFHRSDAGGFGTLIPEPSSSGG